MSQHLSTPSSIEIYCGTIYSSSCNPSLISFDLSLDSSLFSLLNDLISLQSYPQGFFKLFQDFLHLVLTLPVTTATVERSFSTMKYIKNELCNRMGDQWLNDCLTVYIEKDIALRIDNESIMQRFQNCRISFFFFLLL